jgi:hypothetical protein
MHILPYSIPKAEQTAVENAARQLQARVSAFRFVG